MTTAHGDTLSVTMVGMTADNVRPIQPADDRRKVVDVGIRKMLKVTSGDYGDGKIVGDFGSLGVQIFWEKPIVEGLLEHHLIHDRSWVEDLYVVD